MYNPSRSASDAVGHAQQDLLDDGSGLQLPEGGHRGVDRLPQALERLDRQQRDTRPVPQKSS